MLKTIVLVILIILIFSSVLYKYYLNNVNSCSVFDVKTLKGYLSEPTPETEKFSQFNENDHDDGVCKASDTCSVFDIKKNLIYNGCSSKTEKTEKYYTPCGILNENNNLFNNFELGPAANYDGKGCSFPCAPIEQYKPKYCCN